MKILVVEDDVQTGEFIAHLLKEHHYAVDLTPNGELGLSMATTLEYDLILLDLGLPGLDGLTVCRRLRQQNYTQPILLLTARATDQDIVSGLDAGADDYVVKPFQATTLLARIRALLRRGHSPVTTPILRWEALALDPATAEVTYQETPLPLSPKEYSLLELFLRNPKRIFSRNAILDRLWDIDTAPSENAVTNLIKDLRRKLRQGGLEAEVIETLYGLGYRLKSPADVAPMGATSAPPRESAPTESAMATAPPPPPPPLPEPSRKSLSEVLAQYRPVLLQQVAALVDTVTQLAQNCSDSSLHRQAERQAHKLAGGLGTFGYPKASQLARMAENVLIQTPHLSTQDSQYLCQVLSDLQQSVLAEPQSPYPEKPAPTGAVALTGNPRVLVIDDDPLLGHALVAEALAWGLEVVHVPSWPRATAELSVKLPQLVLLDLSLAAESDDGYQVLTRLTQIYPEVPVLVLTERDSLEDRVQVARLGGRAFLHKPLPTDQIFQAMVQVLSKPQSADSSVLIVDDDPVSLAIVRKVLQPWGLQVTSLRDPTRFWEILTVTRPDLLILDVEMPTFNGVELCRVVRQDPAWSGLPILVVTAHTDPASLEQVFAAGADECIGKPIVAADLVTRVVHRLERIQWQRRLQQMA